MPLKNKTVIVEEDNYRLVLVGGTTIQLQIENDGDDTFFDLNSDEAIQLANALMLYAKTPSSEFCDDDLRGDPMQL
ncbi:hypothetical protein JMN32_19710 [Fulvivirga sp. 29W222]|uniref:Uncharacterized protein n=1 Tax=Fulvivirga marina TaxID=2494733 RepID=A0A937KDF2_9BACT|nr:hypothetical protein [Fulvivirga marina]MBL6448547.1 hypothetical protein [Fulvivirga marina]